jgi:ferredoxin
MAKIIQEREKCVGCGACAAVCPKHWEMNADGKASPKGSTVIEGKHVLVLEDVECNRDAANACPVRCISIEE